MSHRVKNVLAAMQSIASQTLRQSGSLEGFKAAFNGRLYALASAHDLLVDEGGRVATCASSCDGP
jgi:two-component system, chemotaxis family, CheB/CheR fusion protein